MSRDEECTWAAGPDMASLATGSARCPARVRENSPELVEWLAGRMLALHIKPEIEAFDLSMISRQSTCGTEGGSSGRCTFSS